MGPFEVISDAGERVIQENLAYLVQFSSTLGTMLGRKTDLQLVWPLRVVIAKNSPRFHSTQIALGRDAYLWVTGQNEPFPAAFRKQLARMLLEENTSRLPAPIENGLEKLFSTLQVDGTHITIGDPPPPNERDRDWTRMEMMASSPENFVHIPVFMNNVEQGGDLAPAYRNAFQKTPVEMEKEVDAYAKAGSFHSSTMAGRALSPTRDIRPRAIDAPDESLAEADAQLAAADASAEKAYLVLHGPPASEGLGILALRAHHDDEARRLFASATESKSESARAWLELGALETDPAKARADFAKAAELNPRWGEPDFRLAGLETDAARKAPLLKKAASLEPRKGPYWRALAQTDQELHDYKGAAAAWSGAMRAAADEQEREATANLRLDVEAQRADFEASEKKRIADEKEADLKRVRDQSHAAIQAAVDSANKKLNPTGEAVPAPTQWWDDSQGTKVEGALTRFDCLGARGRMVITADGKTIQLLVIDPKKLVIAGSGEKSLVCGVQKQPVAVAVQYTSRKDEKYRTGGDVVSLELR